MATTQQTDANRQNAQKSTGPRTPEGKAASRFNALKSGIDAQAEVIPCEDLGALTALQRLEKTVAADQPPHTPAPSPEPPAIEVPEPARRQSNQQPVSKIGFVLETPETCVEQVGPAVPPANPAPVHSQSNRQPVCQLGFVSQSPETVAPLKPIATDSIGLPRRPW